MMSDFPQGTSVTVSEHTVRDTAILLHGHLYLFWSSGVYYTKELASTFDVVLIVPTLYKDDKAFNDVIEQIGVTKVYYYQWQNRENLTQQIKNSRLFKSIIEASKPKCIIQHDYIGVENATLFHWAKVLVPNSLRVVALSSQPSTENTLPVVDDYFRGRLRRLSKRLFLPYLAVECAAVYIKYLRSFRENVLYQFIVLRTIPYLPPSLHANMDSRLIRNLFDRFYVYADCEKAFLSGLIGSKTEIEVVVPPHRTAKDVNDLVYSVQREQPIVVFFPSIIAMSSREEEQELLNLWAQAVCHIESLLPNYRLQMKFHPGRDEEWIKEVEAYLSNRCKKLEFIPKTERAEKLILRSKIIVGDLSTTLWWARNHGRKVVVSIDFKADRSSADMKRYDDVLFFDSIDELSQVDPSVLDTGELEEDSNNRTRRTLLDSIKVHQRAKESSR